MTSSATGPDDLGTYHHIRDGLRWHQDRRPYPNTVIGDNYINCTRMENNELINQVYNTTYFYAPGWESRLDARRNAIDNMGPWRHPIYTAERHLLFLIRRAKARHDFVHQHTEVLKQDRDDAERAVEDVRRTLEEIHIAEDIDRAQYHDRDEAFGQFIRNGGQEVEPTIGEPHDYEAEYDAWRAGTRSSDEEASDTT